MKKTIILSANDNPAYIFYLPLTVWCWNYFGWKVLIFHTHTLGHDPLTHWEECINPKPDFETRWLGSDLKTLYPSETVAQVSRLYGACVADGYLMTGDIDMIPLSDYWQPDMEKLTVYGRDLTDYHYPICYIGAPTEIWREIMLLPSDNYNSLIQFDLERYFDKYASKQKKWVFDQDLITQRINDSPYIPERKDRGTDKKTGYPKGRVDRSSWHLNHVEFIDAHLFHDAHINDESFRKIMLLLRIVWPNENWDWFIDYRNEFKRLIT